MLDEVRLYAWLDCSLLGLTVLLLPALPPALLPSPELSSHTFAYALVYPDKRGLHVLRDIGVVKGVEGSGEAGKTLRECGLEVGDFLDVAVSPAAPDTAAAEPTLAAAEAAGDGEGVAEAKAAQQ